jgi:hypothetical protein
MSAKTSCSSSCADLKIEYEGGRIVDLPAGSMHVVPRGTLHNPIAEEECWIVLIEPVQTKHTGDVQSPLTRTLDEQLGQPQPR